MSRGRWEIEVFGMPLCAGIWYRETRSDARGVSCTRDITFEKGLRSGQVVESK
jgi:hypothetical protein